MCASEGEQGRKVVHVAKDRAGTDVKQGMRIIAFAITQYGCTRSQTGAHTHRRVFDDHA